MSESVDTGQRVTTSTANDGDGGQQSNQQPGGSAPAPTQPTGDANPTPQAGNQQSGEQGPFAVFNDGDSFNKRMDREARSRMNAAAKKAGFDSWEQMTERTTAIQQAVNPQAQTDANADSDRGQSGSGDGPNLQMALQVAQEMNLPVGMIQFLSGGDEGAMKKQAETLLGFSAAPHQPPAGPSIPNAPTGNQAVTFTRSQLQDPAFVRENADAIRQAAANGRIVDS